MTPSLYLTLSFPPSPSLSPSLPPTQDENGLTALMLASASGKAEVVTALVAAGAKADLANQARASARKRLLLLLLKWRGEAGLAD
jgi:ankyrin repeat protein